VLCWPNAGRRFVVGARSRPLIGSEDELRIVTSPVYAPPKKSFLFCTIKILQLSIIVKEYQEQSRWTNGHKYNGMRKGDIKGWESFLRIPALLDMKPDPTPSL
jgi:hypothetical protein